MYETYIFNYICICISKNIIPLNWENSGLPCLRRVLDVLYPAALLSSPNFFPLFESVAAGSPL